MTDSLVPSSAPAVLALFDGPLRDVTFPGADGVELARVIAAAGAAHEDVARAEAALAAARGALDEAQRLVSRQTERTLAYARVYAAEDAALLAIIDAAAGQPPRRGRGRPRKDGAPARARRATAAPGDGAPDRSEEAAAE